MIAIVDYKAGNLTSVQLALDKLDVDAVITRDPAIIREAKRIIFPGDGAARSAMNHLQELDLVNVITEVAANGIPFLGICLGTQIIFNQSDENGGTPLMRLLPGAVKKFKPLDRWTKIPHMGWNTVLFNVDHPLFNGIKSASEFYFIHSYYPKPDDDGIVLANTDYSGVTFSSVVGLNNIAATQFHPERSGRIGLKLLENFAHWDGRC